ncbi:MAG TPA: acyl-CoA dehydrogenase [Acidobacteriota bacterium]|nr:acyl-CoA dehydrogenase [Acidobacteriota bacterium]
MASEAVNDIGVGALPLTVLSEDEEMFRASVRDFAEEQVRPRAARMDAEGRIDPDLVRQFFDLGLMGVEVPETYGGAGGTFFMVIQAVEELSRADASAGVFVDVQNTLVNNAILRWGGEEQKRTILPRLCSGSVGSYALSEAGSGSDAFALATRGREAPGGFVLNGRKLWITNAAEADIFIVFANINPNQGYRGITAFLVERGSEGFTVGRREDKLGIRASSTCELILEDCFVPVERILGEAGKGYRVSIETLNEGRIGIGAQMVGVAQGAFDCAVRYATERKQFGRAISSFQAVQFQIAEMATQLEAARLMVYNTARLKMSGRPFAKEAAMAKYFSSVVAEKVTSLSLEIYGGYGYTREYPVEKYYRDSKIGKIYEGTSNMQLQTIAKQIIPE